MYLKNPNARTFFNDLIKDARSHLSRSLSKPNVQIFVYPHMIRAASSNVYTVKIYNQLCATHSKAEHSDLSKNCIIDENYLMSCWA